MKDRDPLLCSTAVRNVLCSNGKALDARIFGRCGNVQTRCIDSRAGPELLVATLLRVTRARGIGFRPDPTARREERDARCLAQAGLGGGVCPSKRARRAGDHGPEGWAMAVSERNTKEAAPQAAP